MIADDHIHPQFIGQFHLAHCAYTAIHGDHQANPLASQGAHGFIIQPVTLIKSVRDIRPCFHTQSSQELHHQRG